MDEYGSFHKFPADVDITSSFERQGSEKQYDHPSKTGRLRYIERIKNLTRSYTKKDRDKPEPAKIVISRSRWQWLGRLLIHIGPVLAALVMISINLKGYFIGTQFVGATDAESQAIALLALQITAKLFELAVITSLAFIVLDVVHHFLLVDEFGLPLSLSGVGFTFTNLFNLILPSFWSGIGALGSPAIRIGIALLLVGCALIATFIGPAAALLLIPAYKDQWLAGQLYFNAFADDLQIWPTQLNQSHSGGDGCMTPSEQMVNLPWPVMANCSWFSSAIIGNTIANPYLDVSGNLTVYDYEGYFPRDISRSVYNLGNYSQTLWAYSSMSFASGLTELFISQWIDWVDKTSWSFSHKYSRYAYRQALGNQAQFQGTLAPMARAYCISTQRNFSDTSPLPYPVIPLDGNYRQDVNAQHMISTTLVQNTSSVRSFWIPKPDPSAVLPGSRSGMNYVEQFPSAFLAVQAPLDSNTAGMTVTCSVDARWVKATTYCDYSGNLASLGAPTTYTRLEDTVLDATGRPSNNSISPRVDLDVSWLNILTPPLSETPNGSDTLQSLIGLNSLSGILNTAVLNIPVASRKGNVSLVASEVLEYLVPLLIVDGMARLTTWANADSQGFLLDKSTDVADLIAKYDEPGTFKSRPSNSTPLSTMMVWSITIAGYAYSIDGTAYILALVVVLVYILFVLGHIYFLFSKRWRSTAWLSIPEIIALSQNSPQSELLKNTSGGIDKRSTNQLLLRLRVPDVPLGDRENVHVVVSEAGGRSSIQEKTCYHKIEQEKAYH